jgi:four helix bundle protein
MKANGFEDLAIWQESRRINKEIWCLILNSNLTNDYALRNQINRSSGSLMDNIAEGFDRSGNKEFIHFLSIAKASCAEVQSQLYRCLDRDYLDLQKFNELKDATVILGKRIGAFMSYLNKSNIRGSKFGNPQPATRNP